MMIDAEKYKEIVKEKNLSHDEIRQMAGLSERTYNWILKNEYIEKSTLQMLAMVIGSSIADIMKPDPGDAGENVIEFRKGQKVATLTLCQRRYISRVKELSSKFPNECKVLAINKDGSILAEVPTRWIRINPGLDLTEEQKEERARRLWK